MLKIIKEAENLEGKRVLVRVDFNVPIKDGVVVDDTRLQASKLTIEYLIEQKAKVILMTHLGRPEGEFVNDLSVEPIVKKLSEIMEVNVRKLEIGNWPASAKATAGKKIKEMKPGDVAMMENVRFSPDEKKDTGTLSKDLASLADVFVLDGFGVAHREGASVTGVSKYLPSYAGLLLEKEIEGLDKIIKNPTKPLVIVLGGVKIETKIPVIKNLVNIADYILLGGALVNTYFKAKGYEVGGSIVNDEYLDQALEYCGAKNVILPVDVTVGKNDGSDSSVMKIDSGFGLRDSGYGIYDIGPETIKLFSSYIKQAKTLVWNGAMGYFEQKPYDIGTLEIAKLVAEQSKGETFGVIGGGETLQSMDLVGMKDDIDLVSTGGGAMLEYLAGNNLPGIDALQK